MQIACSGREVDILLDKTKSYKQTTKVPCVKTVTFKRPSVMEALELIGKLPSLEEEKERPGEGDFYELRNKFAQLVEEKLKTNRITALVLGEAFAKKVRYGVTYSSDIESVISLITAEI